MSVKKVGALAAATAIALAALAVVLMARTGDTSTTRRANASLDAAISVTVPSVPKVDYVLDLNRVTPRATAVARLKRA